MIELLLQPVQLTVHFEQCLMIRLLLAILAIAWHNVINTHYDQKERKEDNRRKRGMREI